MFLSTLKIFINRSSTLNFNDRFSVNTRQFVYYLDLQTLSILCVFARIFGNY